MKNTLTINDDKFFMQNDKPFDTFIWIGKNFIEVAVTNKRHNTVEVIKTYAKETGNITQEEAMEVFEAQAVADAEEVYVGLESNKYTLVPNDLYDPSEKQSYLSSLFVMDEAEDCEVQKNIPTNCYSVYSIKKPTRDLINEKITKATILSAPAALLIAYQQLLPPSKKLVCFVRLHKHEILITIYTNKELQLHQAYEIENIEDALFYYLNALRVFNLPAGDAIVSIHGSHSGLETFRTILAQNVHTAKFVTRLPTLQYTDGTFSQPAHSFFNLFALILCAS